MAGSWYTLDADTAQHCLVVVIPGIGGSVLRQPGRRGGVVWNGSYSNVIDVLANQDAIRDPDRELVPAGVIRTPMRIALWAPFGGYYNLIDRIARLFKSPAAYGETGPANPKARVVAFPYDFRRSCLENALKLDNFIEGRLTAVGLGRTRSVIIVAHSMGAVVARTWLSKRDRWSMCRQLITLGAPINGAPKALEMVVNGAPWWTGARSRMRETLRLWPGMYDLLPMYRSIMNSDDETPGDHNNKLRPHQIWIGDERSAAVAKLATNAQECYQEITSDWKGRVSDVGVTSFVGTGRKTYQYATWDGHTLRSRKTICPWYQRPGVRDSGDGTVPEVGTVPMERWFDADSVRWGVRVKHSMMPDAKELVDSVLTVLCRLPPPGMAEDFEQLELGARIRGVGDAQAAELDIEDGYAFAEDEKPTIAIEFPADQIVVRPGYKIHHAGAPHGSPPVSRGKFSQVTDVRWEAYLATIPPGEYRIVAGIDEDESDPGAEGRFDVFAAIAE